MKNIIKTRRFYDENTMAQKTISERTTRNWIDDQNKTEKIIN